MNKMATKKTAETKPAETKTAPAAKNTAVEKPVEKKTAAKKPVAEKKAPAAKKPAAAKKAEMIIQSPFGGEITAEDIFAKVGKADKIYVRVDQNKAYWVRGEETGDVDLW